MVITAVLPNICVYNASFALRFKGDFSPEMLEKSINKLIRRQEILRTIFTVVEGQPVQVIVPKLTLFLKVVNLQNLPPAAQEAEALKVSKREMKHHFDLEDSPLIKTTLSQLSSEEHWLLIPLSQKVYLHPFLQCRCSTLTLLSGSGSSLMKKP